MGDYDVIVVKRLPLRFCEVDMIPGTGLSKEFDTLERESNKQFMR